jgi:UDP-N-acetylglucosamine 4-epimerase
MNRYLEIQNKLIARPKTWLITGASGFIGSNLAEALLRLGQRVVGLDNFSTGYKSNWENVRSAVGPELWRNFTPNEADICDLSACENACRGADYVLHQAALGSVPRSIANPMATTLNNVCGFVNMLWAAREAGVKRFVFASSSSVYGDNSTLPKTEGHVGNSLSPYAVSKLVDELYAAVFARCYGLNSVGLRYFNVFGPRQDPNGAYAAVIPKWIDALMRGDQVYINGDGETSRDFCYVTNVTQANLLAATTENPEALNTVYNVAVGDRTTLNELFQQLANALLRHGVIQNLPRPIHREARTGDVRHSQADTSKAEHRLGYAPTHTFPAGLAETVDWYVRKAREDHAERNSASISATTMPTPYPLVPSVP